MKRVFTGALSEEIAQSEGSNDDPTRKALLRKAALGILSIIGEGLKRDEVVRLHRFGTFRLKPVAARTGCHPQTGQPILIPAHRRIVFTPAKALLERVEPTPLKPVLLHPEPPSDSLQSPIAKPDSPLDSTANHAPGKEADTPDSRWPWFGVAAGVITVALWLTFQTPRHETTVATATPPTRNLSVTPPAASTSIRSADSENRSDSASSTDPGVSKRVERSTKIPTEPTALAPSTQIPTKPEMEIPENSAEPTVVALKPPIVTKPFFEVRSYQVADGDTLWHLSGHHYREPIYWPHIYRANLAIIADPDRIYRGDHITLPTLYGKPGALTAEDRTRIAEGYFTVYRYYESQGHPEAIYALIGARWFDQEVFEKHRPQINRQRLRIMELSPLYGDTVPKLLAATFSSL